MSEFEPDHTPAQQLEKRIIERLVSKNLLHEEAVSHLQFKVAEGKMQGPDWKLAFEVSMGLHKQSETEGDNAKEA